MFIRYSAAIATGAVVTFALLFIMQSLIETGKEAVTETQTYRLNDFVRIERNQVVQTREQKPEKVPEPELRPDTPTPDLANDFENELSVSIAAPAMQATPAVASAGFGASDGEYLPIVKVSPVYPVRALARKLEGYVMVEFTVTRSGSVRDVQVLESTAAIFEEPAIEAALKFRYKPRVIDGESVEVSGVRNRISFQMANS